MNNLLDQIWDASDLWRTKTLRRKQYIKHLTRQLKQAVVKAREMLERAETLKHSVNPTEAHGQRLLSFLDKARDHYSQAKYFMAIIQEC